MVADIDPQVIGITESWANKDMVDAELALTGYVLFRKDSRERRGGGLLLYIKESIQTYEITLVKQIVMKQFGVTYLNSTLTV